MSEPKTFTFKINEEDGQYWGEFVELPGCYAAGADLEELLESAEEALQMYLAPSGLPTEPNVVPLKPRRRKSPPMPGSRAAMTSAQFAVYA